MLLLRKNKYSYVEDLSIFRQENYGDNEKKFVDEVIKNLIKDIDAYILETESKITKLREQKANLDKQTKQAIDNMAKDLASSLLGTIKHGFYSKVDFNEVLATYKIKITKNLKSSILELITDAPTKEVKPLDLLKGVSFFLILAENQNRTITSEFIIGTSGELGKILERYLSSIKDRYPKILEETTLLYKNL
ncbi:MAG: hypothetical protein KIT56_09340 [Gammaproteobacteria bacterium]|nr:hypothetical protein [Gammaproteobacteria bacterium]MCW5584058.1 hypothetical protein [Gammaproteobacteria bacterium]